MEMETQIILVTFAFMFFAFVYFWRLHRHAQLVASILTVLGVLGTFVGIAYALYLFDVSDIEHSIPNLLAGLKIAFVTSIGGIALSVVLKIRSAHQQRKAEVAGDPSQAGATIDDLATSLSRLCSLQQEEGEHTRRSLQEIEKALTGEGETTVVTQLQKLRTSLSDKQDELIKSFKEFAETMAENNSKALIQALEEVIRDFNAKINEQFGENFKQLNQAVERILEWQEQYRLQMDELAREFKIAAESIDRSQKSLEVIAQQSSKIGENAEKLSPILLALDERQKSLEDHLSAFKDLSDKAREAFPVIRKNVEDLTIEFSAHVKHAVALGNESVQNLATTVEGQSKRLDSIATDASRSIETIMARTGQNVDKMFQDTSTRIEKQLVNLDEQLEKELTNSLNTLGSQLSSLSAKFVEDYTPLTDKLSQIVRISAGVQNA